MASSFPVEIYRDLEACDGKPVIGAGVPWLLRAILADQYGSIIRKSLL